MDADRERSRRRTDEESLHQLIRQQNEYAEQKLSAQRREVHARRMAELRHSLSEFERIPEATIRAYTDAGEAVRGADQARRSAERYLADHAYTPFWEAVELGIDLLQSHREQLAKAVGLAERFESLRTELLRSGVMEARQVASPPTSLAELADINAHERVAETLSRIVYQAQRDRDFALVYEQRRTTAAVYQGFRAVSAAVASVHAAIGSVRRASRCRRTVEPARDAHACSG